MLLQSAFAQVSVNIDADRFELDQSMIANISVNISNLRNGSFARLGINSDADISIIPTKKGNANYEEFEGKRRFLWNTFPKNGSDFISFKIKVTNYKDPKFSVNVVLSYLEKESQSVIDVVSNPVYFEINKGLSPPIEVANNETKTPSEPKKKNTNNTKSSSTSGTNMNSGLIMTKNEIRSFEKPENMSQHYRIQVVALVNEKSPEKVKSIMKLKTLPKKNFHNGFHIYTVGEFQTEAEAENGLTEIHQSHPNSFIVIFKDGKRIAP
jgi:hypothetical protein